MGFPCGSAGKKNPPAIQETWVQSLGWEDPLEKRKATHSSILAWRISWTTVHGVTKSQTQLSDFHFLSFHLGIMSKTIPVVPTAPRPSITVIPLPPQALGSLLAPSSMHGAPTLSLTGRPSILFYLPDREHSSDQSPLIPSATGAPQ